MNSSEDEHLDPSNEERDNQIQRKAINALKQSKFDYALRDIENGTVSIEKILEDFRIYQAELEIQNDELRQSQALAEFALRRFTNLFQSLPLAGFVIDEKGIIIDANEVSIRNFKPNSKSRLEFFPKLLCKEDHGKFSKLIKDTVKFGSSCLFNIKFKNNQNETLIVDIFSSKMPGINEDTTEDSEDNIALLINDKTKEFHDKKSLKLAAQVFENSLEGMIITDENNIIIDVNQSFTMITGYTKADAIGKHTKLLQSGMHDKQFYEKMWHSIKELGTWSGEVWNRNKFGTIYPEYLTITSIKDETGQITNYIGAFVDITNRKKSEEEITRLAFYDPLTNLPNRRLFKDRLKQSMTSSSRNGKYSAIVFIDLDNFKNINDTLGHEAGDELLIKLSTRIFTCVRGFDTVARLGGDEFVIILEGLDENEVVASVHAEKIANKILDSMRFDFDIKNNTIYTTCSIGIALYKDFQFSEDELLKRADLAMYESKKCGKNNVHFYDPKLQHAINTSLLIHNELIEGLKSNQFELFYQIQVNHDAKPVGVEALLRWNHPIKGLILPNEFIPIAEDTGFINLIGDWVIESACKQLQAWQGSEITNHLVLSINISSKQLQQFDFVEHMISSVKRYNIDPKLLNVEITETTLINNFSDVTEKIQALRSFGVQFALDDFGTGYSSLSYLSSLDVDFIKLDKSFVSKIQPKLGQNAIINAVISIAKSFNIQIISEGIEDAYQFNYLVNHGCQFFQGYLFSKPLPVKQLMQHLIS